MKENPLISIFTPTHDSRFLLETLSRLKRQRYSNWEWIILPNCRANMPKLIDERVRVVDHVSMFDDLKVGAIKAKCCSMARGEILVEMDHDDYLSEDALEHIANAFCDQDADFVYSDFSEFHDGSGDPHVYNTGYGWRYYDVVDKALDGSQVIRKAARAFPAEPPWMLNITHAPNHVRCWKKSFYRTIGGHDPTLSVGDDYDLIVRTYLAGGKMVHIPRCLYFYRFLEGARNTHKTKIQTVTSVVDDIYQRLSVKMMLLHCKKNGLKALDLGSAHGKPPEPGWIGVDQYKGPGVDVRADLNKRWPFEDNSVGLIRCQDFVEHMDDQIYFFNETWRVLAHGGMILVEVPSTDGRGAFQDPTHITFMNRNSFWYYTQKSHARYTPRFGGFHGSFGAYKLRDWYPNNFCKENNILYTQAHLIANKANHPDYVGKDITPLPIPTS